MDVLKRGRTVIGEGNALASGETVEDPCVEIPGRVDRSPSWSRDVSGVKHRGREARSCSCEEKTLDLRFANSVFAEGLAGRRLIVWPLTGHTVHPQAAAVHKYSCAAPQGIHEMRGGFEIETDQVDDRITTETRYRGAERPITLGTRAIERYTLD